MIILYRYLRTIHPISNELRDFLEDNLKEKHLARKDFLLRAGHICSNVYFIEKGLLWSYYLREEKIISSCFTKENEFCLSPESFYSQKYGEEAIQALEDTHVFYISYNDYQRMTKEFPEFNAIVRVPLERCCTLKNQRLKAVWMKSGEDKFNWFVSEYPDLMQRVPARCIASYLGITEGMLSTIRSRPKNR